MRSAVEQPIPVYVHLPHEQDAEAFRERHERGLGAEESPYGYHQAARHGFPVTFSQSSAEGAAVRFVRKALVRALGFDVIHVWRNRARLREAEVVWTHTEREHLAVLLMLALSGAEAPPVIAQSIWLFDKWNGVPAPLRAFYKVLMRRAGVLTVHSDENFRVCRLLFPGQRAAIVRYGVSPEPFLDDAPPIVAKPASDPVRLVAVGNDIHRDWATLVEAMRGRNDLALTILTPRVEAVRAVAAGVPGIEVRTAASLAELKGCYDQSTLLVVPLRPNLHASGITVILEGVARGIPVVCSDVGGLRGYFSENEVCYVPAGDASALIAAVLELAADPERRAAQAAAARARLLRENYSSRRFVADHCRLSLELLGLPAEAPVHHAERADEPALGSRLWEDCEPR